MGDSIKKPKPVKLSLHSRGIWFKKCRGRFYYLYSVTDDPQGKFSLEKWRHDSEFISKGQQPPPYDPLGVKGESYGEQTTRDLCNHFLSHKETLLLSGDLAQRTFDELKATCEFFLGVVGRTLPASMVGPPHFDNVRRKLAERYNVNGQAKRITQIRAVFKVGYEDQLIETPTNFGRSFVKPKAIAFRKLRAERGVRMFSAQEVHKLLAVANVNLRCMILLGLQAGYGNEELGELQREAIEGAWIRSARAKSAIMRRVPLWPETQAALQAAIEHANQWGEKELVFIGARGKPFITPGSNGYRVTGIFDHAKKLAKVERGSFYDLRRTFATIAAETCDQGAVDAIMGHAHSESNIGARYVQNIADERLTKVTEHVRQWWQAGVSK